MSGHMCYIFIYSLVREIICPGLWVPYDRSKAIGRVQITCLVDPSEKTRKEFRDKLGKALKDKAWDGRFYISDTADENP